MSAVPWSSKPSKTTPGVAADEVVIIDSEDGSLPTKNKRMAFLNLADSLIGLSTKTIASVKVTSTTSPFAPGGGDDVFAAFDFDALAVAGPAMNNWQLLDSTNGRVQYIGSSSFTGMFHALLNINSASGKIYTLRMVKDPDGAATSLGETGGIVISSAIQVSLIGDVMADTNDIFELQIKVDSGTDNITVQQMVSTIE